MSDLRCPVCRRPAGLVVLDGGPCMECVRARAAAVADGRCHCPAALRQPIERAHLSRRWVACERCLGTIRQVA